MPLVGFADAKGVEFSKLKEIVLPDHQTPQEMLSDPSVVIAYFFPFTEPIGNSNRSIDGGGPSKEWSNAYHETNTMMKRLNTYLKVQIEMMGYRATSSDLAGKYSHDVLKSRWS